MGKYRHDSVLEDCHKKCKKKCSPVPCKPCRPEPCAVNQCRPVECKKRKKCSSSSSDHCGKVCLPKVTYVASCGSKILSMSLVVTSVDPATYTCPTQICQTIRITYTVTNTGTKSIKGPIYIYTSFTGVNRVTKHKLAVGQSVTVTVKGKISKCACLTGVTDIKVSANSYTYLQDGYLILVSQPVGLVIPRV